jgi:segregation and condensation protein A
MASTTDLAKDPVVGSLGVCSPPPIAIECPAFTGSLAALFDVVRRHKVDLLEVPLLPVCRAYFRYVRETSEEDLDSAGAAVAALAYLVERKAWLLLPAPEPEFEDEPYEPFELGEPSVIEFQAAIEALGIWQEEREKRFFRGGDGAGYEIPFVLGEVSADDLARAFERLLSRATPAPLEPLGRERRSLTEQMTVVLKALRSDWLPLDRLLEPPFTKTEAVWWFLALLELIRLGQARVRLESGEVEFTRATG